MGEAEVSTKHQGSSATQHQPTDASRAKLGELGKLVDFKDDIDLEQQSRQFDMLKQVCTTNSSCTSNLDRECPSVTVSYTHLRAHETEADL
eukprot:1995698-Amphidinium_carterae.1